jgi:hypothetical protein
MKNLILFIVILVNSLIINYINKLEQNECNCSRPWYKDFIKYFSGVTILISSFMILNLKKYIHNKLYNIGEFIYQILGILNVYILFRFTQDIMKTECECSKDWDRKFVYYYSLISTTIYVIWFIISFFNEYIN